MRPPPAVEGSVVDVGCVGVVGVGAVDVPGFI
jgi:hypothetical protein